MRYKITRENYFSEVIYTIQGKGSWRLSALKGFNRMMLVKNQSSGDVYALQEKGLFNPHVFYHDNNKSISKATFHRGLFLSRRVRPLNINGSLYAIRKHSMLVFSITRDGIPIAICKRENRVVLGVIDYELCYSRLMEENEHILLLLFLYYDNTVNRDITALRSRSIIDVTISSKKARETEYTAAAERLIATWGK